MREAESLIPSLSKSPSSADAPRGRPEDVPDSAAVLRPMCLASLHEGRHTRERNEQIRLLLIAAAIDSERFGKRASWHGSVCATEEYKRSYAIAEGIGGLGDDART